MGAELDAYSGRSRISILLSQVANLPVGMLLGSSGLSAMVGDWLESAAVLSTVAVDATIGYQIEHTNDELLASWRRLERGESTVVRQGELATVAVSELVRGDVIVCRAGDLVPADARVIDAHHLRCDEALLTGESQTQEKGTGSVPRNAPIAERTSMLYAATTVIGGHGGAVVTAVGRETEAGRIGQLLAREEAPETPLERRLRTFSNTMATAALGSGFASAICINSGTRCGRERRPSAKISKKFWSRRAHGPDRVAIRRRPPLPPALRPSQPRGPLRRASRSPRGAPLERGRTGPRLREHNDNAPAGAASYLHCPSNAGKTAHDAALAARGSYRG